MIHFYTNYWSNGLKLAFLSPFQVVKIHHICRKLGMGCLTAYHIGSFTCYGRTGLQIIFMTMIIYVRLKTFAVKSFVVHHWNPSTYHDAQTKAQERNIWVDLEASFSLSVYIYHITFTICVAKYLIGSFCLVLITRIWLLHLTLE